MVMTLLYVPPELIDGEADTELGPHSPGYTFTGSSEPGGVAYGRISGSRWVTSGAYEASTVTHEHDDLLAARARDKALTAARLRVPVGLMIAVAALTFAVVFRMGDARA
jgi:hypothetical protein